MSFFNTDKIRELTVASRPITDATQPKLTAKQKAIRQAVNRGEWGCQADSVRALVTAITGVDCSTTKGEGGEFVEGTLIVYKDEILLVRTLDTDGDARILTSALTNETKHGNTYIESDVNWRYATDEEIEEFCK